MSYTNVLQINYNKFIKRLQIDFYKIRNWVRWSQSYPSVSK